MAFAQRYARLALSIISKGRSLSKKKYGAIVCATGYNPISMEKFDEFAYSQSKDVITSLEFERLTNAAGPTGGQLAAPIRMANTRIRLCLCSAWVPDAAARRKARNTARRSAACIQPSMPCSQGINIPDTDVYVFYIDVRTPGKNFDEFYRRAVEEYGVHYIKGMVGKVAPEGEKLMVQASDLLANKQLHIEADLVVLAAAIEPDKSARPLATMLTAIYGYQRFLYRSAQSCARWKARQPACSFRVPARDRRIFRKRFPRLERPQAR